MRKSFLVMVVCGITPFFSLAKDARLKDVLISGMPHVQQKPDFCGEACVEMVLQKMGSRIHQDDVFDFSGLNPLHGRGCYTKELKTAIEKIGFKPGSVWHQVSVKKADQEIGKHFALMHADLQRGVPSIVCMKTGTGSHATEHFRLMLGYDAKKDEIIYHEPAEKDGAYHRMARKTFLKLWPLKYKKDQWTVVRFRLPAGNISKKLKEGTGFSAADYAQHIQELKTKLPGKGFTIDIQPPFVVVGDESPARVRLRSEKTVKWAVERLAKAYFKNDPDHIIDIWLFKDKASYRKNAWILFKDKPSTPYGYASSEHKALVMNIGTGGGTLVHEIVHPMIAANFPACPSWFNEGLGSLYEQSKGVNGEIMGMTNWRLAGLQLALKQKTVPSFKTLTSTRTHEFYNEDPGTNYSQARYLLYYLQQKGILRTYYKEFTANQEQDPTGYETLKKVLKVKDIRVFRKDWEKYTLRLKYP